MHTFHNLHGGVGAFGFLNGDNTLFFHFLHGFGNHLAHSVVIVGGNGGHLLDFLVAVVDFHRLAFQVLHDGGNGLVDTAFEFHRVGTGGHVFQTSVEDGLCQHGGSCGTVTGLVVGLGSDFLHHLSAHVLDGLLQFDFFGYGYTVLGDLRSTEFLVDDDITAFRSECYFYGIGQCVNTFFQTLTGFPVIFNVFCHCFFCFLFIVYFLLFRLFVNFILIETYDLRLKTNTTLSQNLTSNISHLTSYLQIA